jgi:uncharacterized protein (TIGR02996 family)
VIGGADLDLGKPGFLVRLLMRDGLCLLMELRRDVEINKTAPQLGTSLHHGDLISIDQGEVELVFGEFPEHREPNLEAAIARDPDSESGWLVYADWLQERGDPLGERIVRPHNPASDPHWLEGLDAIEVKWRHGMIEGAVFRESLGAALGSARSQITRLLSLRAACFLRELIVDLCADAPSLNRPEIARRAMTFLDQLPPMPALERLCVGYHLSDADPPEPILVKDARFPRLQAGPVFLWRRRGLVEVLDAPGLEGAAKGDWVPVSGMRIAIEGDRIVLARLGDPRAGASSCSFDEVGGRVMIQVTEGHERRVEVNGLAWGLSIFLMPGDLIEVFPEPRDAHPPVRLRFALEA